MSSIISYNVYWDLGQPYSPEQVPHSMQHSQVNDGGHTWYADACSKMSIAQAYSSITLTRLGDFEG